METLGSFRDTARPSAWGSFPLEGIAGIGRALPARAKCRQSCARAPTHWNDELLDQIAVPQKAFS